MRKLSDYELHCMYDDMLDEVYPDCGIAGLNYSTSQALKAIDPVAYRCGFNDWLDSEITEGNIDEEGGEYYAA